MHYLQEICAAIIEVWQQSQGQAALESRFSDGSQVGGHSLKLLGKWRLQREVIVSSTTAQMVEPCAPHKGWSAINPMHRRNQRHELSDTH
jgi:hypothetical protein